MSDGAGAPRGGDATQRVRQGGDKIARDNNVQQ
jgi:hypothetical protein